MAGFITARQVIKKMKTVPIGLVYDMFGVRGLHLCKSDRKKMEHTTDIFHLIYISLDAKGKDKMAGMIEKIIDEVNKKKK